MIKGVAIKQPLIHYLYMELALDRITVEAGKCGGRPCVRGMRIRVVDVLDLLANGLNFEEVLQELPDLELEDIKACLAYARNRIDHLVIAV